MAYCLDVFLQRNLAMIWLFEENGTHMFYQTDDKINRKKTKGKGDKSFALLG